MKLNTQTKTKRRNLGRKRVKIIKPNSSLDVRITKILKQDYSEKEINYIKKHLWSVTIFLFINYPKLFTSLIKLIFFIDYYRPTENKKNTIEISLEEKSGVSYYGYAIGLAQIDTHKHTLTLKTIDREYRHLRETLSFKLSNIKSLKEVRLTRAPSKKG